MTERVLAHLRARRAHEEQLRISVDPVGITVSPEGAAGGTAHLIPWQEIRRILVFKRDLYTHDMIAMWIDSHSIQLEVNETMAGWPELSSQLSRYLPTALPYESWFLKVAFPAMEPAPTEIYVRH
jgi:hypothetical protein